MSCAPACQSCEALRRAALKLVGEAGLDGLSLAAIAERAGIAAAAAAGHYPTSAACVYDTYDEASASFALELADGFGEGTSWESGFARARQRLLLRLARRPAEARLCFVEVLRGDRELRLRRELTRRWIVEFLTEQYERRRAAEQLPQLQIELLIGAGFQAISSAVEAAESPAALERQLRELAAVFGPVAVPGLAAGEEG